MERTGFVMSMLLTFLGVVLLSIGLLVQALLPKIAYMAFSVGGGSYNPHSYGLGMAYYLQQGVALGCIAVGAVLSRRIWRIARTK